MPLPMLPDSPQQQPTTAPTYPVKTKQAAGFVEGVHTEVSSTYFSDKILVTVTQNGRLAQWVRLPQHAKGQPNS